MLEIRLHGRGGQGTVVASKILAEAFFHEGKYVQAFPSFGVERRGAPVAAFIRVGEAGETDFVRCEIYRPHHLIILDATLLKQVNILNGFQKGGWIVVNTPKDPDELNLPVECRLAVLDAKAVAVKNKLGTAAAPIVNVPIAAAFAGATGLLSLESMLKAVKEEVPVRVEENLKAAEEAFKAVKILEPAAGGG